MFYVFASGIVAGIVALLAGFFVSGAVILGVVVLTWAPLAARIGGKSGYEFATELTGWSKQRRRGQHILRAGSLSNAPGGRTRVPGIGAPIEMWWGIDKLGRRFGMSHLPKLHQYTIRLRCSVPGYKGVEQGQVDLDVANWGEFINLSGQTPDIEAIATIIETLPETARGKTRKSRDCANPAPRNSHKLWSASRAPAYVTESSCTPTWRSPSPRTRKPNARIRWQ